MKKIKKLFFLGLNLWVTFVFIGCERETYTDALYQSKVKVSIVNSKALEKNQLLMNKINKSRAFKKDNYGRIITDSLNGFSIDTDKVKYLEGDGFNSYTFEILKPDNTFLDNLVMISKLGGEYKPYAMRYTLTEDEKKKLNTAEAIDFTNKCKASAIEEGATLEEILSKFVYNENCNMVYSWQEIVTTTPCTIDGCWDPMYTGTNISHVLIGTLVCTLGSSSSNGGELGTSPHGGNGGGSLSGDNELGTGDVPCPGDPVKNPEICPSGGVNMEGGTFGCTRNANTICGGNNGKKKHGGMDIQLPPNSRVFAMHPGTVVNKRTVLGASQYVKNSLGNFIEIESIINGQTVRIKYCHLSNNNMTNLNSVSQGTPIALSGTSGNAGASGVIPHLHIQAKVKSGDTWAEVNPINYLDTNFNTTTFQPSGSKSNCN